MLLKLFLGEDQLDPFPAIGPGFESGGVDLAGGVANTREERTPAGAPHVNHERVRGTDGNRALGARVAPAARQIEGHFKNLPTIHFFCHELTLGAGELLSRIQGPAFRRIAGSEEQFLTRLTFRLFRNCGRLRLVHRLCRAWFLLFGIGLFLLRRRWLFLFREGRLPVLDWLDWNERYFVYAEFALADGGISDVKGEPLRAGFDGLSIDVDLKRPPAKRAAGRDEFPDVRLACKGDPALHFELLALLRAPLQQADGDALFQQALPAHDDAQFVIFRRIDVRVGIQQPLPLDAGQAHGVGSLSFIGIIAISKSRLREPFPLSPIPPPCAVLESAV